MIILKLHDKQRAMINNCFIAQKKCIENDFGKIKEVGIADYPQTGLVATNSLKYKINKGDTSAKAIRQQLMKNNGYILYKSHITIDNQKGIIKIPKLGNVSYAVKDQYDEKIQKSEIKSIVIFEYKNQILMKGLY